MLRICLQDCKQDKFFIRNMIGRPFSTKLLITIAALLLLPLLPNRLAGQQERQQSGEYATIGGRRVLLHIVQPKETLFSICRAYNVTQQELLKLNPQLAAGLKAGSSIIIREKTQPPILHRTPQQIQQHYRRAQSSPFQPKSRPKHLPRLSGRELSA